MKRTVTLLFAIILALVLSQPLWAETQKEVEAIKSSNAWLSLVDSGKYAESWHNASSYFKKAIEIDQWEKALGSVREPLGRLISRKAISQKYLKTLPGAPDGDYVVIQYKSSFENKKSAIETVTPSLEEDGSWRVSGYYIK